MFGRRIFTFRKLLLTSVATILTLLVYFSRKHALTSSADDVIDERKEALPRIFMSQPATFRPKLGDVNDLHSNPAKLPTSAAASAGIELGRSKLKSIGLEIISDPRELQLEVHPIMLDKDAEDVFHRFVAELHVECRRHVRLGNVTDGGWDMCVAGPYLPSNGSCLVYSFGIGDNWSFDDDISRRFGCDVRSFDPSINVSNHQRGSKISFYHVGIGAKKSVNGKGWNLMTLSDILKMCNDTGRTIDYLKIDVDSYEWDALEQILSTGSLLSNVKQLGIELHTKELDRIQSTKEELHRYWTILRDLELVGFRRWYWHFNMWGFFPSRTLEKYLSCCYEVVYININFLNSTVYDLRPVV